MESIFDIPDPLEIQMQNERRRLKELVRGGRKKLPAPPKELLLKGQVRPIEKISENFEMFEVFENAVFSVGNVLVVFAYVDASLIFEFSPQIAVYSAELSEEEKREVYEAIRLWALEKEGLLEPSSELLSDLFGLKELPRPELLWFETASVSRERRENRDEFVPRLHVPALTLLGHLPPSLGQEAKEALRALKGRLKAEMKAQTNAWLNKTGDLRKVGSKFVKLEFVPRIRGGVFLQERESLFELTAVVWLDWIVQESAFDHEVAPAWRKVFWKSLDSAFLGPEVEIGGKGILLGEICRLAVRNFPLPDGFAVSHLYTARW